MNRRRARCRRPVLLAAAVASALSVARADADSTLQPGSWEGSLGVDFSTIQMRTQSAESSSNVDSRQRQAIEQVTIENRGWYLYDPLLYTGNIGVTVGLLQDRELTNGRSQSNHTRVTGYSFDSFLLSSMPISGQLYANRSENHLVQAFSHTDSALRSLGVGADLHEDGIFNRWDIHHLRASVRADEQRIDQTSYSVLGSVYRQDQRRRTLTFDGADGFETADLDWRMRLDDSSDRIYPHDSYRSYQLNTGYSLDFGPGLNRRFDSRVSDTGRSGLGDSNLLFVDERLRIDHQSNLSTEQVFQLARTRVRSEAATTGTVTSQANYAPFRNLDGNVAVSATHASLPDGRRDARAGELKLHYQLRLLPHGRFFMNGGGRTRTDDNQLASSAVAVTDEAHAAPALLGAGAGFLLDQFFPSTTGLEVVDVRGGARLPTAIGIDYELISEGNRLRVVPLVTSLVIQPDDPLLVSYAYAVNPSLRYRTTGGWVTAGFNIGVLTLQIGHEQSNPTLLSGRNSGYLLSERRDNAEAMVDLDWRSIRSNSDASWIRYDSNVLAYTQHRYSELATCRPRDNLSVSLFANWMVTNYVLPVRRADEKEVRLSAEYYATHGWWVTASASRRQIRDSSIPDEAVTEAQMRARWDYGRVSISSSLAAGTHDRGVARIKSWSADLSAVRRF